MMTRKKMWEERKNIRVMMRVVKRKGACNLFLLEIDVISIVYIVLKYMRSPTDSEDFNLDEDDYIFLKNNNVTGISGPKPACFLVKVGFLVPFFLVCL
jgi:hypothetical protein